MTMFSKLEYFPPRDPTVSLSWCTQNPPTKTRTYNVTPGNYSWRMSSFLWFIEDLF